MSKVTVSNMLNPNFVVLNPSYVNLVLFIYITKSQFLYVCLSACLSVAMVRSFGMLIGIVLETGFNGYTGVIGYADSEYDIANNILCYVL